MPLFQDRLRADIADHPDRQSLLFGGTGFMDHLQGRVFVPVIGHPRWVPSPQEELRYRNAFPKVWHCWLFVVVCTFIEAALPDLAPLPQILDGAFLPCMVVVAVAVWFWRRIALVRAWHVVEQPEVRRWTLVLASLERWSVVPLSLTLVGLVAFGAWVIPSMRITSEDKPVTPADPNLWLLVAFLSLFAFAYLRAVVWLMVALSRRIRRWTVQQLS